MNRIKKIKSVWNRLATSKDYRSSYLKARVSDDLAAQVHALRLQNGWSQAELAARTGMSQPRVSKLEGSCEGVSTATLTRLANAFDVGLSIKFVPFSTVVTDIVEGVIDRDVVSFDSDQRPKLSCTGVVWRSTDEPSLVSVGITDSYNASQIVSLSSINIAETQTAVEQGYSYVH